MMKKSLLTYGLAGLLLSTNFFTLSFLLPSDKPQLNQLNKYCFGIPYIQRDKDVCNYYVAVVGVEVNAPDDFKPASIEYNDYQAVPMHRPPLPR